MANSYRALTRTYRPQVFDDIVSQEHVSSTLKNAIAQNRLSHAYMFCGPRGVGKTTMARVLARAINQIDDKVDGESLSQTLNVVEIDAASNNKVEDVHHLREIVRVPPQSGRYKIFIIDEVHMLSKAAFNALLKTLEEPPPHAIFIFATTEPHKVLPTILSRVQRFDFKRISVDEIVRRLEEICAKESIVIDKESLHTIAKKADGALRDALGLMDQAIAFCGTNIEYRQLIEALNVVGNDQLFEFTDAVSDQNSDTGLTLIDRLLKEGIDIQEFLVSLTGHIRNLYVAKQSDRMYLVEATEETKSRYIETAKKFSESDLMRILHLVSEAQIKIRDVQQPRVHFEILMLKLIHMGRSSEIQTLLNGLEDLKKKRNSSTTSVNPAEKESGSGSTDNKPSVSMNGSSDSGTKSGTTPQQSDQREENRAQAQGDRSASPKHDVEPERGLDLNQSEPVSNESFEFKAQSAESDSRTETTERDQTVGIKPDEAGGREDEPERDSDSKSNEPIPNESSGMKPRTAESFSRTETTAKDQTEGSKQLEAGDRDDEHVFGRPSLSASDSSKPNPVSKVDEPVATQPKQENKRGPADVSEVQRVWPEYLSLLEQNVSKTIYHQLESVRLKDLKGAELYISVSNVFAVNIVEENKHVLAELLRELVGSHLRFKCVVERKQSASRESMSPYERFKEIQQQDPHLSTIVELFGAEVEY